jgi:DNA-binding NtrC family response regulator
MFEHGIRALTAPDAATAMTYVKQHAEIACVFTDLGLPGDSDGFDLAKAIARERPALPILFGSGGAITPCAHLAVSASRFFRKPYDRDRLVAAIQKAIAARIPHVAL